MVHEPLVFVHMSDTHISAAEGLRVYGADTRQNFREVIRVVREMEARPAFFVISGDLTGSGQRSEYEHLKTLLPELEAFGVPVLLCLGNEDDRLLFRSIILGDAETRDELQPYCHSEIVGGLKVIVLDSKVPGEQWGDLDEGQLIWLDAELERPAELGSIVVMHHPLLPRSAPMVRGQVWANTLHCSDRLAPIVRGRAGLLGILSGHYHLMSLGVFEGVLCATAASTSYLGDPGVCDGGRSREGSGFNLCAVREGRLIVNPVVLPGLQPELSRHPFTQRADYQRLLHQASAARAE
jgi:3',5'-cyclic AMP phosphodiesterase CpdA